MTSPVVPEWVMAIATSPERSCTALVTARCGSLWATTCYHSLYALIGDDFAVLCSEPYDDDTRWQQLPDRSLVCAEPGELSVETLDLGRSTATESLPI